MADNKIRSLSGGEKARLLFAFMSFDAPHLLLLDEPTNHLDIDAREALVQALNAYEGAIVIVSHDPTMVERVADRLWIVDKGKVDNFEGDLDDYRKYIVQQARDAKKKDKKADKPKDKKSGGKARRSTGDIEADIERLTLEKEKLEKQLSDDYSIDVQKKYDAVSAELEELEAEFLAA
jgi:ATP-binding cassette subfamily F protein 3